MAVSYERGKLMPLHRGASSKIVLAHLPPRFVRSFHQAHAADMAAVSLGMSWGEVKRSLRSEGNPESALVGHVTNLIKTGAKLIDASTSAIAAGLVPTRFEARMRQRIDCRFSEQ